MPMVFSQDILSSTHEKKLVAVVSHDETTQENPAPNDFSAPALSTEQQQSVDRLLDYFSKNHLSPSVQLSGHSLSACVSLVEKFQSSIPDAYKKDANIVLDYIIHSVCDYCEQMNVFFFDLTFELRKK